jgi:hypothetical protein
MKSYLLTNFIIGCIAIAIQLLGLMVCQFPIKRDPITLPNCLGRLLISISFAVWAGFLLFTAPVS